MTVPESFPRLHPVYQAVNAQRTSGPSLDSLTPEQIRAGADANSAEAKLLLAKLIEEDRTVESNGLSVRLSIYRPPGTENEQLPVIIYYHGGGWVFGTKYTHSKVIYDLTIRVRAVVVFVDYSLSPEARFPVAVEECFAALKWVLENGKSINADTEKLAVAGDSAGGNLSAVVALLAKERGLPDALKAQVLIYPAVSPHTKEYASYKQFGSGDYLLSANDSKYFRGCYYDPEKPIEDQKMSTPLSATLEEMQGLPPAIIFVAETDILRDEGIDYGRKLTQAGVDVISVVVLGTIHGYITVPVETPQYRHTINTIKYRLTEIFNL